MAGCFRTYGGLLLIVQALAGCSSDAPPQKAEQRAEVAPAQAALAADTQLVVAFGDSLYAGYNLAQDEGFAPALQNHLTASSYKVRVVNAGVSGETTAGGLARLAFTLDGQARKPDLVILGLGGNDMLRGLSPDQTRANLDAMLSELKKRNIPVVLTGMLASANMGPDFATAFNTIYPALAKKHGAALYPFFLQGVAGDARLLLPDGIHPNPAGVQVVVKGIAPLISAALARDE